MHSNGRYFFGKFVLERAQHRVSTIDGQLVSLTPKLFTALLLFVERPGELLDKDALMSALWPGLVVEDNNLSQVISALRRALQDGAQGSRFIETVPRRGFRFVAEVTAEPETPGHRPAPVAAPAVESAEQDIAKQTSPTPAADAASDPLPVAPSAPEQEASPRRRWLLIGVAGAAAGVCGGGWWALGRRVAAESPLDTLAVLPFKAIGSGGDDGLLQLGMADSLVARLSLVPGLVVRSVASVARYGGADQDTQRAARELDVAWIVDGTVQRSGDRVRVTARLLSSRDGRAAWSGNFDEKYTSVFDLQDAISERVASAVAPSLAKRSGSQLPTSSLALGSTRDPDAYQLYLAARLHAQSVRTSGLRQSIALYNRAIGVDPGYALAYAGLVESYRRTLFGADTAPVDAFEPAKVAIRRALELAPTLAEAQSGLAWIKYWYEFDWIGAEQTFRTALRLNPNVSEAHFGLGMLLLSVFGRRDEGYAHLKAARLLDPMSLIVNTIEASYLVGTGDVAQGSARLNRVLEIDPDFWVAWMVSADIALERHRPDDALAAMRRACSLADGSSQALASLGLYLGKTGRRDEAKGILTKLLAESQVRYVPPTTIAALHAGLGETDEALDALNRALTVRDTRLIYLRSDDRWMSLKGHPRFADLLRRMNLDSKITK